MAVPGQGGKLARLAWTRAYALAKAAPNVMPAAVLRTPEREAILHFAGRTHWARALVRDRRSKQVYLGLH